MIEIERKKRLAKKSRLNYMELGEGKCVKYVSKSRNH